MSRLPVVSSDGNAWGTVLNDFLSQAHNADGSIKNLFFNVKDPAYGANGDGATDDTAAIAAARSAANSTIGGIVFYPPGTYITGTQTIYSNVIDVGAGPGATIIKLKNASNADLFSASTASINLAAAYGASSTGGVFQWGMRDLTLDGNKANQTSGPSYCVRVYGYGYFMSNVTIRNGYSGGMLSDWNGGSGGLAPNIDTAATWDAVLFHDNNGIGFQAGGPHDSRMRDCNSFLNGSHGFHIAPNMVGLKAFQCHSYAPALGVSAVPWLIESGYGLYQSCVGEGTDSVQVVFLAQNCSWIGGHLFADGTPNTVIGIQMGQHAGLTPVPSSLNQSAGVTTALVALNNIIDTNITECQSGAISFADEWKSFYRIFAYQTAGTAIASTGPDPSDNFWLIVIGLTPDGTLGKSGGMQLASSAYNGLVYYDQSGNEIFVLNPNTPAFSIGHATLFRGYSDAFSTLQWSINSTNGNIATNGQLALGQSATAVAIATAGTIATANIGVSRLAPIANVTGIILTAGTVAGQFISVINESAFTITFAASGTSHVAGGILVMIPPLTNCDFRWDSGTSLWYSDTAPPLPVQSATAVAIAASGAITTAGLTVSRLAPTAARTGITMQAGTYAGQQCFVINESTFILTYNATPATSLIANSAVVTTLPAVTGRFFCWDSATSLWY